MIRISMITPMAMSTRLSIPPSLLDFTVALVVAVSVTGDVGSTGFPHLGQNSLPASSCLPQYLQNISDDKILSTDNLKLNPI